MDVVSLHEAIAAVCPIHGVSVGDAADKATWRIDYADEATADQRSVAQAVLSTFNPDQVFVVTDLQARLALEAAGLRSAVEAWVSGASQTIQDYWQRSRTIHRNSAFIQQGMGALGISGAQMDALFNQAAKL